MKDLGIKNLMATAKADIIKKNNELMKYHVANTKKAQEDPELLNSFSSKTDDPKQYIRITRQSEGIDLHDKSIEKIKADIESLDKTIEALRQNDLAFNIRSAHESGTEYDSYEIEARAGYKYDLISTPEQLSYILDTHIKPAILKAVSVKIHEHLLSIEKTNLRYPRTVSCKALEMFTNDEITQKGLIKLTYESCDR